MRTHHAFPLVAGCALLTGGCGQDRVTQPSAEVASLAQALPTHASLRSKLRQVLEEQNGGTRLISRNRFRLPTLTARVGMIPMEPASLVMERKMLRGIKERAERLAGDAPSGARGPESS